MPVQLRNAEMVELLRSDFLTRGEAPFWSQGTWTPEILGSISNPTITYVQQVGKYTIIGDVCFWSFRIDLTARSGGSGGIRITLPFTADVQGATFPIRITFLNVTHALSVVFSVSNGNAYGNIRTLEDSGGGAVEQVSAIPASATVIIESSGMMFI